MAEQERAVRRDGGNIGAAPGWWGRRGRENELGHIGWARPGAFRARLCRSAAQKQLCKSVDKECYVGRGSNRSAARYSDTLFTVLAKRRIVGHVKYFV
jgi:hypothetical protein